MALSRVPRGHVSGSGVPGMASRFQGLGEPRRHRAGPTGADRKSLTRSLPRPASASACSRGWECFLPIFCRSFFKSAVFWFFFQLFFCGLLRVGWGILVTSLLPGFFGRRAAILGSRVRAHPAKQSERAWGACARLVAFFFSRFGFAAFLPVNLGEAERDE